MSVPPSELDPDDGVFTVAEGADFNARMAEITGSTTHNPFLIRALLDESLIALENEYGPQPSPWRSRSR